jgi:hypothetical protein
VITEEWKREKNKRREGKGYFKIYNQKIRR